MPDNKQTTSSYLKYLPAIFHEDPFLGSFLLAFEQVLTGRTDVKDSDPKPRKGLEEISANIAQLFDPFGTAEIFKDLNQLLDEPNAGSSLENEKEFLQWLADWTALTLRGDWTPKQQRDLLANIVPLYQRRGTKDNLVDLLRIYAGEESNPKVTEPPDAPFQISHYLKIGTNTRIPCEVSNSQGLQIGDKTRRFGGATPHFFQVEITLRQPERELLKRQSEIVSALVDIQKPAHTHYELIIHSETIQIGNRQRSIINENMLLGDLKIFTPLPENSNA
jgi:phage tail-like protein